jgi:hypothetical protein
MSIFGLSTIGCCVQSETIIDVAGLAQEAPGFVGTTSELAQQENLGLLVSPTAGACNQSG